MNPIQTIREVLRHGIKAINHLGGAREAVPLHEALDTLAELERTHYTAEDVADASAQGFRAGVASVTAGQEPVAWLVCSVNSDGSLSLEHAAAWKEAAHEHINDAITEHGIEGAASWVVRPAYVAAPVAQQPNEWREAVLDWLAPTGKDFPTDTPPREIVKWLMNFEHEVAQQPQAITEEFIDAYLEDYEMLGEAEDGRDACYAPNESEKALIKDAIMGLLAEAPTKQPQAEAVPLDVTKIIDTAVSKFLGWKLPFDFAPDAGISYDRAYRDKWGLPIGTNLLTAQQAKYMFECCLRDALSEIAAAPQPKEQN